MKSEQETSILKPAILALVRQILTVAGTALVAKGYVQSSEIEPVFGALLTTGSVVWTVADKRSRSTLRISVSTIEVGRALSFAGARGRWLSPKQIFVFRDRNCRTGIFPSRKKVQLRT